MTLLSWQVDAHQRSVDADADFEAAKSAAAERLWTDVASDAKGYAHEAGMFDTIDLSDAQRTSVLQSLAAVRTMKRNDPMRGWHAEMIVRTMTDAVDVMIEREAFAEVRFGGEL